MEPILWEAQRGCERAAVISSLLLRRLPSALFRQLPVLLLKGEDSGRARVNSAEQGTLSGLQAGSVPTSHTHAAVIKVAAAASSLRAGQGVAFDSARPVRCLQSRHV